VGLTSTGLSTALTVNSVEESIRLSANGLLARGFRLCPPLPSQPRAHHRSRNPQTWKPCRCILASPNPSLACLSDFRASEHGPANPQDTPASTANGDASVEPGMSLPCRCYRPELAESAADLATVAVHGYRARWRWILRGETQDGQSGRRGPLDKQAHLLLSHSQALPFPLA